MLEKVKIGHFEHPVNQWSTIPGKRVIFLNGVKKKFHSNNVLIELNVLIFELSFYHGKMDW